MQTNTGAFELSKGITSCLWPGIMCDTWAASWLQLPALFSTDCAAARGKLAAGIVFVASAGSCASSALQSWAA